MKFFFDNPLKKKAKYFFFKSLMLHFLNSMVPLGVFSLCICQCSREMSDTINKVFEIFLF